MDVIIRERGSSAALAAADLGIPCVLHGIGAIANVEEEVELHGLISTGRYQTIRRVIWSRQKQPLSRTN